MLRAEGTSSRSLSLEVAFGSPSRAVTLHRFAVHLGLCLRVKLRRWSSPGYLHLGRESAHGVCFHGRDRSPRWVPDDVHLSCSLHAGLSASFLALTLIEELLRASSLSGSWGHGARDGTAACSVSGSLRASPACGSARR